MDIYHKNTMEFLREFTRIIFYPIINNYVPRAFNFSSDFPLCDPLVTRLEG